MTDPHQPIAGAASGASPHAFAASFAPSHGRDSLDDEPSMQFGTGVIASGHTEAAVTRAIVQAFERVESAAGDASVTEPAAAAVHAALEPWLESQWFFALPVSRRGLGAIRAGAIGAHRLATVLAGTGVTALFFKKGVTRSEIEAWTAALSGALTTMPEELAARLWSLETPYAGVRWRDEAAFDDATMLDAWGAARGADAAGLAEHHDLVRAFDAGPEANAPPPETDWRRLVALTAAERDRLRQERIETATSAARRYARLVAARAERDRDPAVRHAAAEALAAFVPALVAERRIGWLRDVMAEIRPTVADVDAPWLQPVLVRLCTESNIVILGEILEDRDSAPADVTAVRDVLAALPRAVEPLATLLAIVEPARTRRLVCLALAAAAAHDPGLLVQNAVGQTWYVVRNIAFVLGRIGDASVVPHLARWARHDDERVRIEVARALGRVRAPGACAPLLALLDDRDARVRQCAVWSLAALSDAAALPALRQRIFEDKAFRALPTEQRDDFFRTYGRLADDAAFEELQRLVGQRSLLGLGWASELRRGAALALGESGRPAAEATLQEHEGARDARVREAVRTALDTLALGPHPLHAFDDDDWSEPARIGPQPNPEARFRLEADDA